MRKLILASTLFFCPLLASADTLIMKDGTRFRGTFNNADARRMTFTEENGNRRDVNILDVQELRFGNEGQGYSSSNQAAPPAPPVYTRGNTIGENLDRLQQDLRIAMDNTNLPPDQRRSLEDARASLQAEVERNRNGRPADQQNLRTSLDRIRSGADRMQREDRDRLNDDIRRISASMSGQQGRDY